MNCANHPDRERVAFCQNCGKPLCQECTRAVGAAVFCEPCLAAKLAGANGPAAGTGAPAYTYDPSAYAAVPLSSNSPSPVLATILGFLPGVGAMYNGQYAKGVVHLIVFAILVTLANENGIFGLFIAGWIIYQAIEANHTARARLAGTPLPNPFGLNDLGERLGFGKAWPSAAPNANPEASNPQGAAPAGAPAMPGYVPPPSGYPPYPPPVAQWGAPAESYGYAPPTAAPYAAVPLAEGPYGQPSRRRFPTGAIWLIGLGVLFLIGNAGIFHNLGVVRLLPVFLIGLGVWLFVHKMTDSGAGLADDGTAMYRMRLFRALRGSVWTVLVGLLFLLDNFGILSWGRSWPLFIIVGGLMVFFERTVYSDAAVMGYPYGTTPAASPATAPVSSTSVVPAPVQGGDSHDSHNEHDGERN